MIASKRILVLKHLLGSTVIKSEIITRMLQTFRHTSNIFILLLFY